VTSATAPAVGGRHRKGPSSWALLLAVFCVVGLAAGCTRPTTPRAERGGRAVTVEGQPAPPGMGSLEAVSCATALRCWAVGDSAASTGSGGPSDVVVDSTKNGARTWNETQVMVANPMDLGDISCPDVHHCTAVGAISGTAQLLGAVLQTSDGGRSWQSVDAPSGSVDLVGVTCITADQCTVLATDGSSYWTATTTDGGSVWQRQGNLPAGFSGPSDISCPTAQSCIVAGYTSPTAGKGVGAVATTTDGGADWTLSDVPSGTGLLHGVSCPTIEHCVAVGTVSTTATDVALGKAVILNSDDGGQSWQLAGGPPGVDDAFAVSCPTVQLCATVGTVWTPTNPPTPIGGVVTSSDGGATWLTPRSLYLPVGLVSVDCASARSCVAVGNDSIVRIALPRPSEGQGPPPDHE
jgi:photosystem II stability/assembly factor-like uncharacterized protein